MQDLELLAKHFGLSDDAVREYFVKSVDKKSASSNHITAECDDLTQLIRSRIEEGNAQCARGHRHYEACRMMYETPVITQTIIPLIPYIMGQVKEEEIIKVLKTHSCGHDVIRDSPEGEYLDRAGIAGKFVTFGRSVIQKRAAAQNRNFDVYPLLKYEAQGQEPHDKLRADVLTSRVETIVEQMGLRSVHEEIPLYLLYYGFVFTVPKTFWEKEKATVYNADGINTITRTVREGLSFKIVEPNRFAYDQSHGPKTITSDSGCKWFSEFCIIPYGHVYDNMDCYFNIKEIKGSSGLSNSYRTLINDYNLTLDPAMLRLFEFERNLRENQAGVYSSNNLDQPIVIHRIWMKVNFSKYGIGTYEEPVWCEFHVASGNTVIYAKLLPGCPGAYESLLQMSACELSPSMAHDLMQTDMILSTLWNRLYDLVMQGSGRFIFLNQDLIVNAKSESDPDGDQALDKILRNPQCLQKSHIFSMSFSNLRDLGVMEGAGGTNFKDMVCQVSSLDINSGSILDIIRLIVQATEIGERAVSLAPQEQGQHGPHEISATESAAISFGGEAIYSAITLSIDKVRAGWKRILYQHLMAFGSPDVRVQVMDRYSKEVIRKAGFEVEPENRTEFNTRRGHVTVLGTTRNLVYDYYFTSRDGANRIRNTEAANTLTQLLGMISAPGIMEAVGEQYPEIVKKAINEVFRLTSSVGLQIEEDVSGENPVTNIQRITQVLGEFGSKFQEMAQRDEVIAKKVGELEAVISKLQQMDTNGKN